MINGFSAGGRWCPLGSLFAVGHGALPVRVIAAWLKLSISRCQAPVSSVHRCTLGSAHMPRVAVPADQSVAASRALDMTNKYGLELSTSSMYLARFAENSDKLRAAVSV